ncbi:MAG: glycosyltransferase family 4 protein [Acidiferrobacterales bacterium]|nr:glycosyltransferase family 4 protein [Acidiferrobacterales bacterium]
MTSLTLSILVICTAFVSWYLVRRLIVVLTQRKIFDTPNERSLHQGEVPRGGGLAIIFMLMLATLILGLLSARYAMFGAILLSLLAWSGLSWLDDQLNLSPLSRWLVQCIYAVVCVLAFGAVDIVHLSSQNYLLLPYFGVFLSVVGVLWLANLYNFMDGMDGLAASQSIIASGTLAFWFWQFGDQSIATICLVLASASYGFLLWNWQPAKIFMGDVGSVTIGAFFAILILIAVSRYNMPVISFMLLLGVFIADATITLVRRSIKREKIWLPHRSHYYQRLANLGFNHAKIVFGLIILMSISSLIATMTFVYRDTIVIGIIVEVAMLVGCVVFVEYLERNN